MLILKRLIKREKDLDKKIKFILYTRNYIIIYLYKYLNTYLLYKRENAMLCMKELLLLLLLITIS